MYAYKHIHTTQYKTSPHLVLREQAQNVRQLK